MLCDLLYLIHRRQTPNHGGIKTMATITMGTKVRNLKSGANKKTYTIGRHGDFETHWRFNQVSRLHCAIFTQSDGSYYVQDLNSSGGTMLDGLFIGLERTPLRDGSVIGFGQKGTRWESGFEAGFNK